MIEKKTRIVHKSIINKKMVKAIAKANGKRVGRSFLYAVEVFLHRKIKQACEVHNGGAKTLDATIAGYVGIS
jgi:antitoxin component YwqK of YwqJK toxin-antitoxin module